MTFLKKIFPAFAVAVGVFMLLYAVLPHGIGLSEDSISYIAAAKSLNRSGELRDIDGSWFTAWAPLYPLLLAVLLHLPVAPEHSLATLNLAVFALTLFTTWLLIKRTIEKMFFRIACFCAILFSFTLIQAFGIALSEAVFILLINCIALASFNLQRANHKLFLLALFCSLALLLRYIGIFLIPVAVLFLLQEKTAQFSYRKTATLVLVSVLPLVLWLTRNYLLTETLTGFRADSGISYQKNLLVLADTFTGWLLPIKISLYIRLLVVAGILVALHKGFFRERNRIHLLLVAGYFCALITAYFLFSFEEPRDRLLAPVFISFFILLLSGLEIFASHLSSSVLRTVLAALLCIWLIYPATRTIKHLVIWHEDGVEIYNKPYWQNSETLAWLRVKKNTLSGNILSNDPSAIYYFAGIQAGRVPKKIYSFDLFHLSVSDGAVLVWWKNKPLYSISAIREKYNLEEVKQLNDAVVFRMTIR